MRPRRCYKNSSMSNKIAVQKRNLVIVSDEENTSEYSHSPSSQHSTLESNCEVPQTLKATATQDKHHDSELSSEADSCDESDELPSVRNTKATKTATPQYTSAAGMLQNQVPHTTAATAVKKANIIAIPTFEADGAVNMV